jgi:amino acid adenylation domain-containing protein
MTGARSRPVADLLARLGGVQSEPSLERRARSGPVPASYEQRTLWFLDRLTPGDASYHTGAMFTLAGELDEAALRRALATVVDRHESLRTAFDDTPDGPVQRILSTVDVALAVTEVAGGDAASRREHARRLAVADTRAPFDLSHGPLWRARLLRLDPTEHVLVFVAHHIVVDGWSFEVFARDLSACYRAELGDPKARLAPLALQYADYSQWQHEWLNGPTHDELTAYWREQLAGLPTVEFPPDRPRPARMTYRGNRRERLLPAEVADAVQALARTERTTSFVVYLAAFLVLLHRYTGLTDTVVGSPSANRGRFETEPLIGFFATMLVLRTDLSGDPTARELLGRVRDVVRGAFAHGELPFERLVDALRPPRDPARSPLFQVGFTAEEWSPPPALPGLTVDREYVDAGTSRFDMSWWVTSRPDGVHISVEYNSDLYDQETVDQLITHYAAALHGIVAAPGGRISEVPLLSSEERDELLTRWAGPVRPVREVTLAELVARQAITRPYAVALVAGGAQTSYAELDERANRLAHLLVEAGAGTDRPVALCLPRQTELIVAMLAVLKAGAAYVPLDPAHPAARLAAILRDCDPATVVCTGSTAAALPDGFPVLRLDAERDRLASASPQPPPQSAGPHDLAYILYTSGSTGVPKGVPVEHRSVVNFMDAMRDQFDLCETDRVLGYAAATFDVSVLEIFAALLYGGRLYLATDEERLDIDRLQRLLTGSAITFSDMPPSVMALLDPGLLPALRIAFTGFEAFPGDLVNQWNKGRRFFNGYGPTECTITMTVQECAGQQRGAAPIGYAIANHVAHVLDGRGEPVPYGVAGELVIGGVGLARGYLNQDDLTRRVFYDDPFGTSPGGRLYRTGDLVRRRRDGALVFLGRIDQQVKIRGLRIELGEIESVLSGHPGVEHVAVDVRPDARGERHLVAYLKAAGGPLQPAELRSHAAARLPGYMVPAYWVILDALPRLSSGKVDRRALPAPDVTALPAAAGGRGPATETERVLAEEIVPAVVGLDRAGVTDDFFALGGNSLQAAQLVSRAARAFQVEIGLADFLQSPTVADLAAVIDRQREADEALLAQIEQMSDAEAARLLQIEGG